MSDDDRYSSDDSFDAWVEAECKNNPTFKADLEREYSSWKEKMEKHKNSANDDLAIPLDNIP